MLQLVRKSRLALNQADVVCRRDPEPVLDKLLLLSETERSESSEDDRDRIHDRSLSTRNWNVFDNGSDSEISETRQESPRTAVASNATA